MRKWEVHYQNSVQSPFGWIESAGIAQTQKSKVVPARRLGLYALIYLLEGEGNYSDELGNKKKVKPGDLFVLFPEIQHTYSSEGKLWKELYIVFSGSAFDCWRNTGLLDPHHPFYHIEPIDRWRHRMEHVISITKSLGSSRSLGSVCLLQQFLADVLIHKTNTGLNEMDQAWVARACELLNDINVIYDPQKISSQLKTSHGTFRYKFAKLMGIPPHRYRLHRLIERACEMLQFQPHTHKEIAEICGFYDEFHFSKMFKKIVGITPKEFRRKRGHSVR